MNVLLIFEYIPEETKVFYIPNVSDEDMKLLDSANGKYINYDEDVENDLLKISDFVEEYKEHCNDKDNPENCKWYRYLVKKTKGEGPVLDMSNHCVDRLYICGWM